MVNKFHSLLALAASATMGAGVLVAETPAQQTLDNHNAREAIPPAGPGSTATPDQAMQTDQLIAQQLNAISQDPTTAPDKLFVLNSAIDSMDEVRLSQTIEDRSTDQQVKQLAQHMITDHEALNSKLAQTAQELGVVLPRTLPSMKNQEAEIFAALPAKTIDQQYLAEMNAGHAKTIACFEAASTLSQNPRVRQLASDALPTLHEHRKMVQQVANSMGINFRQGNEAIPAGAELRASDQNSSGVNTNSAVNPNSPANNPDQTLHTTDKGGR
jgi:predicted outer membrane protein